MWTLLHLASCDGASRKFTVRDESLPLFHSTENTFENSTRLALQIDNSNPKEGSSIMVLVPVSNSSLQWIRNGLAPKSLPAPNEGIQISPARSCGIATGWAKKSRYPQAPRPLGSNCLVASPLKHDVVP